MQSTREISSISLFSLPKPDIQFSILQEKDIAEAAECLAQAFTDGEPMTHELNITQEEFKVFSTHICKSAAKHGLSIIARDRKNGQFVGCRIVEPADADDKLPELSEKFSPIFALLETASKPLHDLMNDKKVVHFVTLAVNQKYQGYGIAKQLLALQLYYLSQTEYQYFCAEFTNPRSYAAIKAILACDIEHSHEIDFATFSYKNSHPFAKLSGKTVSCFNSVNMLKSDFRDWAALQKIENGAIPIKIGETARNRA